jgi:hypothetical protein
LKVLTVFIFIFSQSKTDIKTQIYTEVPSCASV